MSSVNIEPLLFQSHQEKGGKPAGTLVLVLELLNKT